MKAVYFTAFGGPEVLQWGDLPEPHAGRQEVRILVRAAGVNASDWKRREGQMERALPQTLGYEAAGIVDQVGEGVTGIAVGDRVFGLCGSGAAQAERAVLTAFAPLPQALGFDEAAALPVALETAARCLDRLGPVDGLTVLIQGAAGNIGSAAVQLACARGARVIGTARPATWETVRSLGAEPVASGDGLSDRVRALCPAGVDLALDAAGPGNLHELIDLTGSPDRVLTVADAPGALKHRVHFSRGEDGRALDILSQIGDLLSEGRF